MRNTLILSFSSMLFLGLFIFGLISIQTNSIRAPFYYYPDGYIMSSHHQDYKNFLGGYIYPAEIEKVKKLFSDKNILNHKISVYTMPGKFSTFKDISFLFLDKENIVLDFLADIIIALLFFVTGVLLYYYVRDIYIFLLFISVSLLIIFNFFVLTFHIYYFLYFLIIYFLGFIILNLVFRFQGKEISLKWFFPQIAFSFLIGYIGYMEQDSVITFYKIRNLGFFFIFLTSNLLILTMIYQIFKENETKQMLAKKLALIFGMLSVVVVPFILFKYSLISFEYIRIYNIFSYGVFPFVFIYGTYRYTMVPIQFFFNRSLAIVYQIAVYILFYLMLQFFINYLTPGKAATQILNVIFIVTSVYFIEPVQHLIFDQVAYWTFKKNKQLRITLDQISARISSPISVKATIVSIMRTIIKTLKVKRTMILIPGDKFPKMDPKNIYLMKIPSNSEIWHYLTSSDEIIITSHLAYGSGIRESVYNFLKDIEVQLAYPMLGYEKGITTAAIFLVGEKIDGSNFTLGELTFIKECSRLAELLLYNYSLLVNEVEKKKLVRDLNFASILDKTLNIYEPVQNINIGFLSLPAVGISGDYIDIIPLDENKLMLFLGDVVGHGLGSGYLASAIRGLIRDQIKLEKELSEIFLTINKFLKDRYSGNEFMSLIGGIYYRHSGEFEYINAGHIPILIQSVDGIRKFERSQQVLGISEANYQSMKIKIDSGNRIIIYSDGIIEAFNENDKMYGLDRFFKILKENIGINPVHLAREIEKEMIAFRGEREQSDDISFICLENTQTSE